MSDQGTSEFEAAALARELGNFRRMRNRLATHCTKPELASLDAIADCVQSVVDIQASIRERMAAEARADLDSLVEDEGASS